MAQNGKTSTAPWYKEKFPKSKYLSKGRPIWLFEEDIPVIVADWIAPSKEEMDLWESAKFAVIQKNKKREYLLSFDDSPLRMGNRYRMEIQVLHIDYTGLIFVGEGTTLEEVQKRFWPTVLKLVAHFFSPRLADRRVFID